MNDTDKKHLKLCIENDVPKNSKGHVVYWKEEKTNCFEFRKVSGDVGEDLSGVYVFEFDVYTKVKIPFDDIEHVVLTEFKAHEDNGDKYNLRELYDN